MQTRPTTLRRLHRNCVRVAGVHGPRGIGMFVDAGVRVRFRGGWCRRGEPLPPLAVTPTIAPMVAEITPLSGPLNSCETVRTPVSKGSPASARVCSDRRRGPDLSREGPFDACDADQEPGQSPMVLDSMSGCQYRMTSYEERTNRDDLDPSYGMHLHDPRMMEYMGAPESARLLGRTPEYWLEHMGRERTIQAALRLHHDASLIMTNVQIMSQLVTSFSRTASEVMRTVYDREPFPTSAVDFVKPGRRVRRAAHYTWPLWACGDQPVLRSFRVPFRPHHATRVWHVKIASRTGDSENITTSGQ